MATISSSDSRDDWPGLSTASRVSAEAGITDVASFTDWYWDGQMGTARLLIGSTTLFALLGGLFYWPSAPRVKREEPVA
jgi:hypothetical protein